MIGPLRAFGLYRLGLRHAKALERVADALEDVRDHLLGTSTVAINRDDPDDRGVGITYASDEETAALEAAENRRFEKYGSGPREPFGV